MERKPSGMFFFTALDGVFKKRECTFRFKRRKRGGGWGRRGVGGVTEHSEDANEQRSSFRKTTVPTSPAHRGEEPCPEGGV